jgi:hypothetical protein
VAPGALSESQAEKLIFLSAYGWTMWAVQLFEYNLAGLTILRTPVKSAGRQLDSPQKMYSALSKQFSVFRHRFERASAKELRDLLPGDLPEVLDAELDELITLRNDLAHRYLRRVLATPGVDLRHESQALQVLGNRFDDARDQLLSLMEEAAAHRPPNLSDLQYEALQKLGQAAAEGTSLLDALADLSASDSE